MKGKFKDSASEDAKPEDDQDTSDSNDQDTSDSDDRETSDSDDQETSDSDIEQNLGIHSQSAVDASICLRCSYMKFLVHLGFTVLSCIDISSCFL